MKMRNNGVRYLSLSTLETQLVRGYQADDTRQLELVSHRFHSEWHARDSIIPFLSRRGQCSR